MFEPAEIHSLFDLSHTAAAALLQTLRYPWEALPKIGALILELGRSLPAGEYELPAIIGPGTEVRQCAFVRGNALVGADCVVGNSTELKNVILFDGVQVPHYNYVGDSILGYKAHMGAGSITSNIKSDKTNVCFHAGGEQIETGLRKIGAMLGDHVEVGCNTVLNPVVGRETTIYPLSMVRGFVPPHSIYKHAGEIAERK